MANRYTRSGSERSIQPRTVSSGIDSSSGLNQDSAWLEPREQDLDLLPLRVDGVVALILVVLQRREIPDAVGELAHRLGQAERLEQLVGPAGERALERGVGLDVGFELLVGTLPRLPVGKDVRQVPLEPIGDLLTEPAADSGRLSRGDVGRTEAG